MDVAVLQSFLPAGTAQPARILRSSGKTAIATLPPTLRRKPGLRIPKSIRSRLPKGEATELSHWSFVIGIMLYNHLTLDA